MLRDKNAALQDVTTAVGILVTLIICVLICYNIAGSIDVTDVDTNFPDHSNTTRAVGPAQNASADVLDHTATFFQIAPIIVVVIVAVVILKYVGMI